MFMSVRTHSFLLAAGVLLVAQAARLGAQSANAPVPAATDEEKVSLHAQGTMVFQNHPAFAAAYAGPDSMANHEETRETVSSDVYAGARLWAGAEAFADGLAWQGFGLSNAVGAAGFPNGEAFRLGTHRPDAIVARLFVRHTIALGSEAEAVEPDALALGGKRPTSRLTFTLGKLSVKDIFDNNAYANDPRTQFLNWALMANEAWDYPADSLGYTTGAAVEWTVPGWAGRGGFFQMPRVSNGLQLDMHLAKAWGMVAELERDYKIGTRAGAVWVLLFGNRADMGSYQAAVDAPARPADLVATRAYRGKAGLGLNFEQEVADGVGVFARASWNDGRNESWVFADVDRALTLGASVRGQRWGRADDTLGLALAANGISAVHERYFAAGGTGILVGDGTLRYGEERIVETYYDVKMARGIAVALDFQYIANPAYNRDRGPIPVFGARTHLEY